jgi:putative DNA primase/helicase
LLPDTSQQKILFMSGPPRSGKGKSGRVLASVIGLPNVAGPTLSTLAGRFGLYELRDKLLAIISDARLSGKADQAVITERLLSISGEDLQMIERKYRDAQTVKLPTRIMIMSNELPRLTDASGALTSRMLFVPLLKSWLGKEDRTLTDRLISDRAGILQWALKGLQRLRQRGHFIQPAKGRRQAQILKAICSPISTFVEECCELGPELRERKSTLFESWKNWAEDRALSPKSDSMFARDLYAAYPDIDEVRAGTNYRAYAFKGIRIRKGESTTTGGPYLT